MNHPIGDAAKHWDDMYRAKATDQGPCCSPACD